MRDLVADKLKRHRGIDITRDDVLITSGSLQGLDLVNDLLLEPGDTVIFEELSYGGAISRVKKRGVTVVPVALDADGMRMDALADALAALKAKGVTPKYIYTIPTIQNPTGSILPLDRRHRMLELAREYGVPIFEDECYADLIWAGISTTPPAIYSLDPAQVIHIGSFSKTLAPALRAAYAVAPWPVLSRLVSLKTDGGTGAVEQMLVAEYFGKHFDSHVDALTGVLKEKLQTHGRGGGARVRRGGRALRAEGRHLPLDQAAGSGRRHEAGAARGEAGHPVQPRPGMGGRSGRGEVAAPPLLRAAVEGGDPRGRRRLRPGLLRGDRHPGAERQCPSCGRHRLSRAASGLSPREGQARARTHASAAARTRRPRRGLWSLGHRMALARRPGPAGCARVTEQGEFEGSHPCPRCHGSAPEAPCSARPGPR